METVQTNHFFLIRWNLPLWHGIDRFLSIFLAIDRAIRRSTQKRFIPFLDLHVVSEVIDYLKLDNFILVGWSLGGHIALELTNKLPKLKDILITGTPPFEISAEGLSKGFRITNPKILECFGKGNLSEEEAELFATLSGYDYSIEKRFIVDAILQTDFGAKTIYPQSILKGIGLNEVVIVNEWAHPIAVIAGGKDAGINNDYIIHEVQFRNLWRGKVHVIPDAGHAVQMDQPDKFNALLNDFLQDIFKN